MGIDSHSLKAYGGFNRMLAEILASNRLSGSAYPDFAHTLYEVLAHHKDPAQLLAHRGNADKVAQEIRLGIETMSTEKREEVRSKIEALLEG